MTPNPLVKALQVAINDIFTRYNLHQPHLETDGIYGPKTKQASRWAQWILGFHNADIGHWEIHLVIRWLSHPSLYFAGHPGGYSRHRNRLAAVRSNHSATYIFPVHGPLVEGRTDRGQDMETVPGAAITAIGNATITANPGDIGIGQIVMELDTPYRGWRHPYVFHLDNSLVSEGERVARGQVIAHSSNRPPGAEDMPGHIEYGFAINSAGDIQPASDGTHYTSSGQAMHDLLHSLDPSRIGRDAIIA